MKATLCTLATLAVLAIVGVSAASASPPVITHIPGPSASPPNTVTGVCSFQFTDYPTVTNYTEIDFYNNGNLTGANIDFFGSDTYVGPNGATLVNNGGHFAVRILLDSNGNIISDYGNGVIENVPLPDGSTFFAAGRADFVAHGLMPIYLPDWGHSRNLAGFCAALGA
jgi:hypothetical protein